MAEVDLTQAIGDVIQPTKILGGLQSIVYIILLFAFLMIIVLFIMNTMQYKHQFIIREIINNRKIIFRDKAKEVKTKDGMVYWKLQKRKDRIPLPPSESIELNSKGRKVVEAYRTETGEYIFLKDTGNTMAIPDSIKSLSGAAQTAALEKWRKDNGVVSAFQPLTTNQRIIIINEIKKAQLRRTKKWQEFLLPVVSIAALVIIVVALMIFYGEMGKPLLAMADKQHAMEVTRLEELKIIQSIQQDVQLLKADSGIGQPPE